MQPRKSRKFKKPSASLSSEDSSGDLVFFLEVGFDDGRRGWTFSWCHLVPPSYLLSLETSLFRPANGSFTTSAGHLSVHIFILLLVWKQTPTLQPRLVLPQPPEWWRCGCLSSCQIPHFGYVLLSFMKCPLKNNGQAHKGATIRVCTPLLCLVFYRYSKGCPFEFLHAPSGPQLRCFASNSSFYITWMESRHPSASAICHWFSCPQFETAS